MLIYIDTDSGTWGAGEGNIVFLEATDGDLEALEEMTDTEIIEFGKANR